MVDCEREVVIAMRAWKGHELKDEMGVCEVSVAQPEACESNSLALTLEV